MTRPPRRGPWLPEEDGALIELIRVQGPNNWTRISKQLRCRSPKQCRERYHQNLRPGLQHDPISPQEGKRIEQLVEEIGKRWVVISRRLGNRSDNAVKNWWNGNISRRKRRPSQQKDVRDSAERLPSVPTAIPQPPPFDFSACILPNKGASASMLHPPQKSWPSRQNTAPDIIRVSLPRLDHYVSSTTPLVATTLAMENIADEQQQQSDPRPCDQYRRQVDARSHLPSPHLPTSFNSRANLIRVPDANQCSVSPALSDLAHLCWIWPPPSLVSITQRTRLGRPKPLTCPKTGPIPCTGSIGHRKCHLEQTRSSANQGVKEQLVSSSLQIETLVIPPTASIVTPSTSQCQLMQYHDDKSDPYYGQATSPRTEPLRDSRMRVSSLVR